jgi:hypothetical protein
MSEITSSPQAVALDTPHAQDEWWAQLKIMTAAPTS